MIYDWYCEKCDLESETVESIREYTGKRSCTACGNACIRLFHRCKIHLSGTKVEDAEFNVGLGRITKSKAHRAELAKQLGVQEIGNDAKSPESIHKHFESERETKKQRAWDEV